MDLAWKWAAKSALQKGFSLLPDPDRWNHLAQRVMGRDEFAGDTITTRLELAAMHVDAMVGAGVADPADGLPPGTRVAELGTGWHPAIPILMHLLGADEVLSIDHVDHTSDDNVRATVRGLAEAAVDGRLAKFLPAARPDRVEQVIELSARVDGSAGDRVLATFGVQSIVSDVRELVVDRPVDAVVSNLVLEHVPADILPGVLRSSYELCRPGGVMSHVIDMCDHGSYVDPALSQFNFLRFGERAWRVVGNDIQHENRLRHSQVVALYEQAGVPATTASVRRGDWPELARVPLAEPFRHLDRDDLLVIMAHMVSART